MNETEIGPRPTRLRLAPVGRFAGDIHELDLGAELAALRAEPHAAKDGHRQVTLFHRIPVAHVLFAFDPGGRLPRHTAKGLVTIQALEGRLIVEAGGTNHELRAGQMLVLNPNVPHDVHAVDESAMLLTVHMEDGR